MDDLYRAFDDRAQVILHRLDARKWDLLVGVIESTDRVQHMMWRFIDKTHPMYNEADAAKYGDSIERVYRRVDQFVGEVLEHLRARHPGARHVGSRVPLVPPRGQPEHVAGQRRLPRDQGPADRDEEPERHVPRVAGSSGRTWTGRARRPTRWASARSSSTSRAARARASSTPREDTGRGRRPGGAADDADRSRQRRAHRQQRLQARRDLQRPVPEGRAGPPGGHGRRLSRVLADHARRIAAGRHRLPNTRKWSGDHCGFDYKTIPGSLISNRKLAVQDPRDHRHRPDRAEVLRRARPEGDGRQARSSDADARTLPRVRPPRVAPPRGGARRGQAGAAAAGALVLAARSPPAAGRRTPPAPRRWPAARRPASRRCSARPTTSRRASGPCSRDLRTLEVERDLRAEAVHRQRARPAAHRARDRRHRDPDRHARADRASRSCPTSRRAWSSSTSWATAATSACS